MASLYAISNEHNDAIRKLLELDMDEQTIADTIEGMGLKDALEDKLEACAKYRENLLVTAQAKKDLSKKLSEESKQIEQKCERLYESIDAAMRKNKIEKLPCDYFTLKYRKLTESVVVEDQSKVSSDWIRTKITESVDKVAAKKALQSGEVIEGLKLSDPETKLEIK